MNIKAQHVLAVFLGLLIFSSTAVSEPPFLKGIVGTWVAEATVINPPAGFPPGFEAIVSVNPGGTVILTTNLPNGVTPGQGTWEQTGPNRYTWTFYFYEPNTVIPGYPLLLKTRVVENILITGHGDTYITKAQIQPLNPLTGTVLETVDGTVTATRLALSSYSAQP